MGCTLNSRSINEPELPPHDSHPAFAAVKPGLCLMSRDKFPSKYTGEIMHKWRKVEIVERNGPIVLVHFIGWSDTYDFTLHLEKDVSLLCPMGLLTKEECQNGVELNKKQIEIVKEFLESGSLSSNNLAKQSTNVSVQKNLKIYQVGDHVDILDIFQQKGKNRMTKKWRKATVIDADGSKIKIHYIGWDSKYDEVLDVIENIDRISEFGTKSSEQTSVSVVKSPQRNPHQLTVAHPQQTSGLLTKTSSSIDSTRSTITLSEENGFDLEKVDPNLLAEFEAEINREMVFIQKLAAIQLIVVDIEGDGNCLFRAISHQLYSREDRHMELRSKCVEHMRKHRSRFERFCDTNFDDYLTEMAKRGTWGDDLEIRAMEEIFDRIVRIYSSNAADVCVPLKNNFEEEHLLQGVAPIILSYHGNSHYNSIYDENHPLPLSPRNTCVLLKVRMGLQSEQQIIPATRTKESTPTQTAGLNHHNNRSPVITR